MRKTGVVSAIVHILAGASALLWLLWYFIPLGGAGKGGLTLGIAVLACWLMIRNGRRSVVAGRQEEARPEIPLLDTREPVVLVCGDDPERLFAGQPLRKTAQGYWLRVDDISTLHDVVCVIQDEQPRQVGQLAVMYVCQADRHQDEAVLRAAAKALRQHIHRLSERVGFRVPLVLLGEFSGPETPWTVVRGDRPALFPADEAPQAVEEWQKTTGNLALMPVLREAWAFMQTVLLEELQKADRLCPAVYPFAAALRCGAVAGDGRSLWGDWLQRRGGLRFPYLAGRAEAARFPDAVLPLLTPWCAPVQGGRHTRRLVFVLWGCALAALAFSAANNGALIRQVGAGLQRWYAIPMSHHQPKAQALAVLKRDALLLERWQRQGEPLRYALGYYPGQRLWLALQKAIDAYVPPTPPPEIIPEPAPEIIRLDSMSLFDSGQWRLKPGSTKVLVNALVGIRAKPGWLIIVAGHTDSTGDERANQALSLKRAGAVRDWMLNNGDVPESCFAVQGYGESRPVATNDTAEGRALNRRVEISLVPQAGACRLPE
jgi:outer membrane protein OmpA-like peptidoglycan-associated protein